MPHALILLFDQSKHLTDISFQTLTKDQLCEKHYDYSLILVLALAELVVKQLLSRYTLAIKTVAEKF